MPSPALVIFFVDPSNRLPLTKKKSGGAQGGKKKEKLEYRQDFRRSTLFDYISTFEVGFTIYTAVTPLPKRFGVKTIIQLQLLGVAAWRSWKLERSTSIDS